MAIAFSPSSSSYTFESKFFNDLFGKHQNVENILRDILEKQEKLNGQLSFVRAVIRGLEGYKKGNDSVSPDDLSNYFVDIDGKRMSLADALDALGVNPEEITSIADIDGLLDALDREESNLNTLSQPLITEIARKANTLSQLAELLSAWLNVYTQLWTRIIGR